MAGKDGVPVAAAPEAAAGVVAVPFLVPLVVGLADG